MYILYNILLSPIKFFLSRAGLVKNIKLWTARF